MQDHGLLIVELRPGEGCLATVDLHSYSLGWSSRLQVCVDPVSH